MGGSVGRVDKKVVHVNNEPPFCNHIMERVIHELLEGGRRIGETEEHYSWFEESFMGKESGFPLVSIFDTDVVIFPTDIKLGENLCPLQFINEVRDEWEGICIADHVFIDIAIVLTGAEATVLLFNKEKRGCLWGV